MHWTKPAFEEWSLGMEVTGYVNTDDPNPPREDQQASNGMPPTSATSIVLQPERQRP